MEETIYLLNANKILAESSDKLIDITDLIPSELNIKHIESNSSSYLIIAEKKASYQVLKQMKIPPEGIDLEGLEKHLIQKAYDMTSGNISKAAPLLGLTYKTLQYRLDKYDIKYVPSE